MNNDPDCKEKGQNWGKDFNGSWIFELQSGAGLQETAYIYCETSSGVCSDAALLQDPSTKDPGFYCTGAYADLKPVVKGEEDFIKAVVKGVFKIKGPMPKVMANAQFIKAMASSISSFQTEYLGE